VISSRNLLAVFYLFYYLSSHSIVAKVRYIKISPFNFTLSDFALHQNFPNPFNPVTIIRYSIPLKSQVEIVIYNTLGEKVKQLVSEEKEAGSYSVEFNASSLPSGNYFYRLQVYAPGRAGSFVETKKMVLLR